MKIVNNQAAQGDCLFRRIDKLPQGLKEVPRSEPGHIVAHSETGHHHVVPDVLVHHYAGSDPLVSYLQIDGDTADVVHLRSFDTHETLRLPGGGSVFEVRRAREWTPEGWRQVAD